MRFAVRVVIELPVMIVRKLALDLTVIVFPSSVIPCVDIIVTPVLPLLLPVGLVVLAVVALVVLMF